MSLREVMRKNPAVGIVVAVLAVALAAGIAMSRSDRVSRIPDQYYYYDLQSGKFFAASVSDVPIDAPDGGPGQGVRATVYSCGSCNDGEMQVAYIQSLTDRAMSVVSKGKPSTEDLKGQLAYGDALADGLIVAAPPADGEAPRWAPAASPQGGRIMMTFREACGGNPKRCLP